MKHTHPHCSVPGCRRHATDGTLCQKHAYASRACAPSRRALVLQWLVELGLARDLREATHLLERVVPRRRAQPLAADAPSYFDDDEATIVEGYRRLAGDE